LLKALSICLTISGCSSNGGRAMGRARQVGMPGTNVGRGA
jgi:hypothetical protein